MPIELEDKSVNGVVKHLRDMEWKIDSYATCVLGDGRAKICNIRGWGYLTGKGHALGLDEVTAEAVQFRLGHILAAASDSLFALECAETARILGFTNDRRERVKIYAPWADLAKIVADPKKPHASLTKNEMQARLDSLAICLNARARMKANGCQLVDLKDVRTASDFFTPIDKPTLFANQEKDTHEYGD